MRYEKMITMRLHISLWADLNEHLKTICACGMEAEMSDTGFCEMTFTPQGK